MRRRRLADLLALLALLGYAAVSFAYFGRHLLPHPGRVVVGTGSDTDIFIWSFAWWPHAIGTWTNPFVSHALYAPTGINLTWTASAPGLALAFAPLTALVGPVASYNAAAVLLPALAAWTAYLLCRHLTGSNWASLVGGYLFGFSTAILRQQLFGHLHMTAVFLLPLIALVVVRFVEGKLSGRGLAWRLGVLLAAQLWLSTELALTLTLMLALALGLALLLVPAARQRVRAALAPIVAGYGLGALLAAPLLVYVALGANGEGYSDLSNAGSDLLSFVVPTKVIGLGGSSVGSVGHLTAGGASAYLGLPTLAIVVWLLVRDRGNGWVRFLGAALGVSAFLALGTALEVRGHRVVTLPWVGAEHVPLLNNALPFRLATYASLAAGVMVAVWTATTRGLLYPRPYVLPALAVVALVPAVWRTTYPTFDPSHPPRPAFFADGLYRSCIPKGETVAVFPFAGDSLVWQAESGFRFRLASNGLRPLPKHASPLTRFDGDPIVWELTWLDIGRPTMDRLLEFAAVHGVDRVVSVAGDGYPTPVQMRRFGRAERIGGVVVAPGCGQPSLASRDLSPYLARYRAEQAGSRSNIGYCRGTYFYELAEGLYPAGALAGATRARFVQGTGLTCLPPPEGYVRRGFASADLGVPADTYPYYAPA